MEKIDLSATIIERFTIANDNNRELERLNTLFSYFIKDNIDNLFGRNQFDEDELDIVKVKDGLVVDSIFGIKLCIDMSNDGDFAIVAKNGDSDEVFFSIYMGDKIAINECFVGDHSYKYAIDIAEDRFSYTVTDANQETEFEAYLLPLGAKRNTFEIFEYKRMIPEQTDTKTLFGRIVGKINGEGFVKLDMGYALKDVVSHAKIIFDKLKRSSKRKRTSIKNRKTRKLILVFFIIFLLLVIIVFFF